MDKFWRYSGEDPSWGVLANWWDDLEEFGEGHSDVQATSLPAAGDALYFRGNGSPQGGPGAATTFSVVDTSNLAADVTIAGTVRVSGQLTLGYVDWQQPPHHRFAGVILAGCNLTKTENGDVALVNGALVGNNCTIPFDLMPCGSDGGTITIGNGCTLNGGARDDGWQSGGGTINVGTGATVNSNLLFGWVEWGGGAGCAVNIGAGATINATQDQRGRSGETISLGASSQVNADILNSGGVNLGGSTVVGAGRTVSSSGQGAVLNVGAACVLGAGSAYTFQEGNGRIAVGDSVTVGDGCSFSVGSQWWEQNGEITWGSGTVFQGGVSVHANQGGTARIPGSGTLTMKGNVSCVADKPEMTDDGTVEFGYSLVKTGKFALTLSAVHVNVPVGFAVQITDPAGSANLQGRGVTAPIVSEAGGGPIVV